MPLIKRVVAGF